MEGARRVPGWTPVDFFILRHGQTTWNARGIIQGQADAPLDDVGRAQARALAEFLVGDGLSAGRTRGFPRPGLPVVTSDLSRAVDTAASTPWRSFARVSSQKSDSSFSFSWRRRIFSALAIEALPATSIFASSARDEASLA